MMWEPKDVIAGIIVVGGLTLLGLGINSWVGGSLLGLIAAYYGIDLTPQIKLGRRQQPKKEEDE